MYDDICACSELHDHCFKKAEQARDLHLFSLWLSFTGMMLGVAACYVTVYTEVLFNSGYSGYQSQISYLGLSIQVVVITVLIGIGKWIDYTKTF